MGGGVRPERRAVEAGPLREDDRRHAGASILAGKADAVDVRLGDAGSAAEHVADLLSRDVLALPAERVPGTVDEVVVALRVAAQQVAGPEPGIARRERVADELPL